MKLRLDKVLTDLNGRPLMVDKSKEELKEELDRIEKANKDKADKDKDKTRPSLERPFVIRDVCDKAFLSATIRKDKNGNFMKDKDGNLMSEPIIRTEREARYQLAVKTRRGEDLKDDDIEKLKGLIADAYASSTLITGVMNTVILAGKPVEHGQFKPACLPDRQEGEK